MTAMKIINIDLEFSDIFSYYRFNGCFEKY